MKHAELSLAKKKLKKDPVKLDRKNADTEVLDSDCSYGVLVKVIDYGVGITAEDIEAIADVGTSFERNRETIRKTPEWLQPTAEFGIGLQAAFLVTDHITVYTHPRTNEEYKIEFQATGDKGDGFINVTPLEENEKMVQYGTIFELFIPSDKLKEQQLAIGKELRYSRDPFTNEYEQKAPIWIARGWEMELPFYLDSLIGEQLFPIKLRIYDFEEDVEIRYLKKKISHRELKKLECTIFIDGTKLDIYDRQEEPGLQSGTEGKTKTEDEQKKEISYITRAYMLSCEQEKDVFTGKVKDGFQYALDCREPKLYLWNSRTNVYARFGSDRLQSLRLQAKNMDTDEEESKTKVFYKGIYVKSFAWKEDANLLEYIDIKGKLQREHLAMNRGDFTQAGYHYIRETIYPAVIKAAHDALESCEKSTAFFVKLKENLYRRMTYSCISDMEKQNMILSIIGLASFAQIQSAAKYIAPSPKEKCQEWDRLLAEISEKIKEEYQLAWTDSTFFSLDTLLGEICSQNHGGMEYILCKNVIDIICIV